MHLRDSEGVEHRGVEDRDGLGVEGHRKLANLRRDPRVVVNVRRVLVRIAVDRVVQQPW